MDWWEAFLAPMAERPRWRTVYQIKDQKTGLTVLHRMRWHWDMKAGQFFEELEQADQQFANDLFDIVQKACGYFYLDDDEYEPLEPIPSIVISDDDVRERIQRGHNGELKREAEAQNKLQYPLPELPFDQQRAMLQHIEQLKMHWRYKRMGVYVDPDHADIVKAALEPDG